jgi:hypothetical protein
MNIVDSVNKLIRSMPIVALHRLSSDSKDWYQSAVDYCRDESIRIIFLIPKWTGTRECTVCCALSCESTGYAGMGRCGGEL